jgi:hypothetical protein
MLGSWSHFWGFRYFISSSIVLLKSAVNVSLSDSKRLEVKNDLMSRLDLSLPVYLKLALSLTLPDLK